MRLSFIHVYIKRSSEIIKIEILVENTVMKNISLMEECQNNENNQH
jgi:hypothetical protein